MTRGCGWAEDQFGEQSRDRHPPALSREHPGVVTGAGLEWMTRAEKAEAREADFRERLAAETERANNLQQQVLWHIAVEDAWARTITDLRSAIRKALGVSREKGDLPMRAILNAALDASFQSYVAAVPAPKEER